MPIFLAVSGRDVPKHGDLQTSEDMTRERREWVVQRVGWGVMALFLAAGVAGVFGSGPLARASVGDDTLRVAYPRMARYQSPVALEVTAVATRTELRISVPARYAKDAGITRVSPEPDRVELRDDRYVYVFPVAAPGQFRVAFELEPSHIGTIRGEVAVDGVTTVRFDHFVVP